MLSLSYALAMAGTYAAVGVAAGLAGANIQAALQSPWLFPFAVFAEEWGYLGTAMVLIMFLCLVMWCLNLASQARDRFSAHLCVGIAALFLWHILINVGMVLQLLPVTGVTLPFFSLGGSNALTMMIGIGVLLSVSRARKRKD